MRQSGRGGFVVMSSPTKNGVAVSGIEAAAHADDTDYLKGDTVIVEAGAEKKQAYCTQSHTSSTSGGLTITGGNLAGTDVDNWREVPVGTLVQLRNWTLTGSQATEDITVVLDDEDTTESRTDANTASLDVFMDPKDNAQKAFEPNVNAKFELYPMGNTTTPYPKRTFTGTIADVNEGFSTTPLSISLSINIQGGVTREVIS